MTQGTDISRGHLREMQVRREAEASGGESGGESWGFHGNGLYTRAACAPRRPGPCRRSWRRALGDRTRGSWEPLEAPRLVVSRFQGSEDVLVQAPWSWHRRICPGFTGWLWVAHLVRGWGCHGARQHPPFPVPGLPRVVPCPALLALCPIDSRGAAALADGDFAVFSLLIL